MQFMQLTDWLVVIFVVAIVAVLLDGVRRKLAERSKRVVMKLDKNLPRDDIDPDALPNSELPNGGARTLVRDGQLAPSLRTLQSKRKLSFRAARSVSGLDEPGARAVPVLLDTVDVEEERIEHANVFADTDTEESFEADELIDGLDEEYEEDAMLGEQTTAGKQSGYMETRYQGRDDDDDELDDEEEFDDEEEDDEDDEFEEEIDSPDELEDEDDLDDDDDEDDEELDDEDNLDDDDEEDDEEEDEEEEDLDELEGLPEDDWGSEEEQDVLIDDYENEPMPLQGAYDKAASHFDKAANHFNRPARQEAPRIEPGFGSGISGEPGVGSVDGDQFTENFSASWDEESVPPVVAKPMPGKRDQGELFREPARAPGPQEVIIINVMARSGQALYGSELLAVLQEQGLRLGDMSIFHRHAENNGSGAVMFSMANMVKPGTFDLATMDQFTTPGVSFFLQMPNRQGNMACFEKMLGAATAVRNAFDGELKDEHRSVFTRQTVEHCRQRVRDFELKLLSRK